MNCTLKGLSHKMTFDPCKNGVDWTETGHAQKKNNKDGEISGKMEQKYRM